jgi:hypothetical protein
MFWIEVQTLALPGTLGSGPEDAGGVVWAVEGGALGGGG